MAPCLILPSLQASDLLVDDGMGEEASAVRAKAQQRDGSLGEGGAG